ncbi:MAG: DUF262 domain-containing protein [Acidimicrobiia bacterium]
MQANTLTPFQLFGAQVRYVVPMFQRPYVWTLEDQWEPLWSDIRTLAERVLEATGPTYGVPDAPPHFLGAVVLDQQLVPSPYTTVRHVVDGQQRLTTLQLLLDAAQWVVQRHGEQADASALGMLILNNPAVLRHEDEVFKVWPSNPDRAAFRTVMRDDLAPGPELTSARIVQAHKFFAGEIAEWADPSGDPDKVRERLHALSLVLMQLLKVVVIDLEPGDNAQVIFETLNHRGTPLLAGDLVKNFVFQLAEIEATDVDSLYNDLWSPFDAEAWRRQIKQGRLYRPRIDVFLNYWLAMRRAHDVPTDRVFSDFREYASALGAPMKVVVEDLASSAKVFDHLDRWPWTSVEGTFAYRALSVMEQYALGPLLLWLLGWDEDRLSVPERHLALRSLESWLVRRMLCRMTAKQVNMLVIDLLKDLVAAGPETAGATVVAFFAGHEAESRKWPTDDEVRDALRVQPLYTGITRARLRMVLEAIEDRLRTPLSDEQHCARGTYTIEHVLPQGWGQYWPLPAGDPELLTFERDRVVQRLGNLTLVNNKLNPSLSNRPWTDADAQAAGYDFGKRSLLQQHGTLHMNTRIVTGWPECWDEEGIVARGEKLADLVLAIWPSGDAFASEVAHP